MLPIDNLLEENPKTDTTKRHDTNKTKNNISRNNPFFNLLNTNFFDKTN